MIGDAITPSYDFFISYAGEDEAWAEWIAWELKEAGYSLRFQKWHFGPGKVWVTEMQKALAQCVRMIAVLSPDYLASKHGQAEYNVFYAKDPDGAKALLVPVRIVRFDRHDLHKTRNYIDFAGKSEVDCRNALLAGVNPIEPSAAPAFPGSSGEPAAAPAFPGGDAKTPPAAALKTAIPHYLPRLDHFHGREKELAQIRDALRPEKRTWGALIAGPGGMGKTSLAVRAASEYTREQFDPVIFVSIKDRALEDEGPRAVTVRFVSHYLGILDEIARALGRDDIPRSSPEDRARLILDALTGTRALLILDNLESLTPDDRERIVEFVSDLPGVCKAILTARRRIGRGINLIELDKLDEAAALKTLADIAEHNKLLARASEDDRRTLWQETAGIPLLLRWTAGQLGRGACRTIAGAIAFLRSCPEHNDPLEFIFGDLAKEFTPEETKVLCALTYFTLPAKVEHIAAIAGLAEPLTDTALRTLANRSLVIDNTEGTHYTLVPLVADFLRQSRPDVIAETGDRMEKRAYALIMENGWQEHARFPVLEVAWPSVAPALPRFLASDNVRLQRVCNALHHFLDFQGRWDELISLNEKAEAKALSASDHLEAGWRAYDAGWIPYLRGQGDVVITCANRAAGHWQTASAGARERATAIRLRGLGHRLRKDYPAAIADFRESLELFRRLAAESANVVAGLNSLAGAEKDSGDLASAERDYREGFRVAEAIGDTEGVASIIGSLADLALHRQDWPQAEALARKALPFAEAVHRKELIAFDNRRLAKALVRQGKAAEGLPYARKAVGVFELLGSRGLEEARAILAECQRSLALERLTPGWTHNTTALEGNTLTAEEVAAALRDPAAIFAARPAGHVAATRAQGEANVLLAELVPQRRDWTREDLFRLQSVHTRRC